MTILVAFDAFDEGFRTVEAVTVPVVVDDIVDIVVQVNVCLGGDECGVSPRSQC